MRPINFIKTMSATVCLVSILLHLQGCVNDDLSDCGVSVEFKYTKNIEGVDKFKEKVSRVNLFVFDSNGLFVDEFMEEGSRLESPGFSIPLNLMPGKYDLIAWGNLSDNYELTPFVPGETHINDAKLSLIRPADDVVSVDGKPTDLFHGALFQVDVLPDVQTNQYLTIDMMKDTKDIKVTAIGLPVNPTKSSIDGYECKIISRNGDYKFDNSITGDARLRYISEAHVNENKELISGFKTLRELNDNSTDSRLIIDYNSSEDGVYREMYNQSLVALILPATVTGNLDIDDEFDIEIEFDATNSKVTVTVNGWKASESNWELGW